MKIASLKENLVEKVVQELLIYLKDSVSEFGCANILLSGGNTPGPIYRLLNKKCHFLDKLNIGLVDERFVKTSSDYSNERLIRDCFSVNKKNMPRIDGMVYNSEDKNENLKLLSQKYNHFSDRTDVVILGMGKDGHTASIFPNDLESEHALSSSESFLNTNAPTFPKDRISCSMSMICDARFIILIITGKEKMDVLMNQNTDLPIHEVMRRRKDLILYYTE